MGLTDVPEERLESLSYLLPFVSVLFGCAFPMDHFGLFNLIILQRILLEIGTINLIFVCVSIQNYDNVRVCQT